MKRLFALTLLMLAMVGMTSQSAFAQRGNDRLRLGDAAPGLDVSDWWFGGEDFVMERGVSYGVP